MLRVAISLQPDQPHVVCPGRGIADHQVYCWGRNDDGQLGDGTMELRTLPVAVVQGS